MIHSGGFLYPLPSLSLSISPPNSFQCKCHDFVLARDFCFSSLGNYILDTMSCAKGVFKGILSSTFKQIVVVPNLLLSDWLTSYLASSVRKVPRLYPGPEVEAEPGVPQATAPPPVPDTTVEPSQEEETAKKEEEEEGSPSEKERESDRRRVGVDEARDTETEPNEDEEVELGPEEEEPPVRRGHKGKSAQSGGKSKGKSKGSAGGEEKHFTVVCRHYMRARGGCRRGDKCTYIHSFAEAGRSGKCYSCGDPDNWHRREDCPTLKKLS